MFLARTPPQHLDIAVMRATTRPKEKLFRTGDLHMVLFLPHLAEHKQQAIRARDERRENRS